MIDNLRAQIAQDQRNLSSHLMVLSKNTLGKRMSQLESLVQGLVKAVNSPSNSGDKEAKAQAAAAQKQIYEAKREFE